MVKPFPCIFDVALDLTAHDAWSLRAWETLHADSFLPSILFPYLAALSSICLHSCFSQSGPWLTFNSALTDTGRRLSKRGPSNNEMWNLLWATSGSATDSTHTKYRGPVSLMSSELSDWTQPCLSPLRHSWSHRFCQPGKALQQKQKVQSCSKCSWYLRRP